VKKSPNKPSHLTLISSLFSSLHHERLRRIAPGGQRAYLRPVLNAKEDRSDEVVPKRTRWKPFVFGGAVFGAFALGVVVTRGVAANAPSPTIEAPLSAAVSESSAETKQEPRSFSLALASKSTANIVIADLRLIDQFVDEHAEVWEEELDVPAPDEGDLIIQGINVTTRYPTEGKRIDRAKLKAAIVSASGDTPKIEVPLEVVASTHTKESLDRAKSTAEALLRAEIELLTDGGTKPRKLIAKPATLARALRIVPTANDYSVDLDAKELKSWMERAEKQWGHRAEDARFETGGQGSVRIVPSKKGTRIDLSRISSALKEAALRDDRKGVLPIGDDEAPSFSTEDAQALRIKGLVATFTTRFPPKKPRVKNIERIAELIDGTIVKPGEVFSLNRAAGPRSKERGFVLAPSIGDGEIRDTWGGGVSQFATTLYNAVFDAGYVILDHKPHRYWFDRYPMGIEATLSWPKPDLIFRNDTEAGLLIKTVMTDGTVTVLLYGDNAGRHVDRKVGQPYAFEDPRVEREGDPAVDVDDEEVKEPGSRGFTVDVARVIRTLNGKPREEKRVVVYRARPRVLRVHPCKIPRGGKGYTGRPCPTEESNSDKERSRAPE
jgi:vancomycin resistance protein YoaR